VVKRKLVLRILTFPSLFLEKFIQLFYRLI